MLRPRSVGARVVVRDSLSGAVFDGKPLFGTGGVTALESDGFSAGAAHYDIEIKGGASHVTVDVA